MLSVITTSAFCTAFIGFVVNSNFTLCFSANSNAILIILFLGKYLRGLEIEKFAPSFIAPIVKSLHTLLPSPIHVIFIFLIGPFSSTIVCRSDKA